MRFGVRLKNWTSNNRLVPVEKGVLQSCILSPCLVNLYAEYIMRNAGLEEAQAGIKISRRNINNLRYAVPGSCQHSLFFFFFFFCLGPHCSFSSSLFSPISSSLPLSSQSLFLLLFLFLTVSNFT